MDTIMYKFTIFLQHSNKGVSKHETRNEFHRKISGKI